MFEVRPLSREKVWGEGSRTPSLSGLCRRRDSIFKQELLLLLTNAARRLIRAQASIIVIQRAQCRYVYRVNWHLCTS